MYIKSVIIDGFKSYGTRTEIKGFDPQFNAITGLNGTGKSNILDSICFVLGISNLTNVRANSLGDLIYKCGQAGIKKASVTILFDNSDASRSPITYEHLNEINVTREIVVSGKNRYLINDSTVPNRQVIDLFSSIQLNVNNPHFLIMQGRITKVLNMDPREILSMIEEASGTQMYEHKKIRAKNTIEKKDNKIKDLDKMANESINPKLQKLKEETIMYREYQRINRELDHLNRLHVAYLYLEKEEAKTNAEAQLEDHIKKQEDVKDGLRKGHERMESLHKQVQELQSKCDLEGGGILKEYIGELQTVSTAAAICSARLNSEKEDLYAEMEKNKQLEKIAADYENALTVIQLKLDNEQNVFDKLRAAEKEDNDALVSAQAKFEVVCSGLISNEEGVETLEDQLISAKRLIIEAETEITECNMNIEHNKAEYEKKKSLLKSTELEFAKNNNDLEVKEKELKTLEAALRGLNYEDGLVDNLRHQQMALSEQMRSSMLELTSMTQRFPFLNFVFDDPEPNFDRRQVRGLLCKLFKVKDEKFCRPLETAAGEKLYNVVVDNEHISAILIQKGNLSWRTTFAPLNKIQGSRICEKTIEEAEEIVGRGNVVLAQSLVNYEPMYESVMAWTFGHIFICTSTDAAVKVAFHSKLMRKTIDLEGNVFDPRGILSGGAVDKSPSVLAALVGISEVETRLNSIKADYREVIRRLNEVAPVANEFESIKLKFDVCSAELERVKIRLQDTPHYKLLQELENLQAEINSKEERIKVCKLTINDKSPKLKELENNMRNLQSIREKALSDAEAALKKVKIKAEGSRNEWKQREQEFAALSLEIQELKKSFQNAKLESEKSIKTIVKLQETIAQRTVEMESLQEEVQTKKAQVKTQKDAILQKEKEIQSLETEQRKITSEIDENKLNLKSLENYIKGCKNEIKKTQNALAKMRRDHEWIEEERLYFGAPNGAYDFTTNDPKEAGLKIEELRKTADKIRRTVSSNAINMLKTYEEQFQDVMTKKGIVVVDRSKILSVIEHLDVRKEGVIKEAWEKVNHDFNSIVSSLLPGAHAKLKPVDGQSFLDGLEIKVGFGGLWKDSLHELSGGQRSLIALSFILAMLLFKPAPLYILDEVDAALDPAHTRNIGQMLKAHFKQSQFIIVSLKDGMFNNANVLFRTSFVDGMSTVIRTVGGSSTG